MAVPKTVPQTNPAIKSHLSFDLYTGMVSLMIERSTARPCYKTSNYIFLFCSYRSYLNITSIADARKAPISRYNAILVVLAERLRRSYPLLLTFV